jgi:hypothetical protein
MSASIAAPVALVLVGVLTAGAAVAQDALGDGRALDNSLEHGRTYNPTGPNTHSKIAAEVAYRNALVTGNAANGMSFRESVGYNSTFDFRTEFSPVTGNEIPLPSNETYNFLRDSLTSSYPSLGLRGIDAIREQAAWGTGNLYDEDLNIPILKRSGGGQSGEQLSAEAKLIEDGYESYFIDPFRLRPRTLRSTTEHTIGAALETRILGQTRNEQTDQLEYLQSTPLRGIVSEMVVTENMIKLFDGKPIGAPDLLSERVDDATDGEPAFGYDAVVERMSRLFHERYTTPGTDAPATSPGGASTNPINGARDLPGATGTDGPTSPESAGTPGPGGTTDALDLLRSQLLGLRPIDNAQDEPARTGVIEALRKLYGNPGSAEPSRIDRLAPSKGNRNLFAENMRKGEELLAAARWFDAEERFSAALRLSPGDPMAAVGRLHAQLGAGLYLSAGINFDRLMRSSPELIAARYDERLLPRRGRLQRIDARLRLNTRQSSDLAVSSALLMAYLAHQIDDRLSLTDAFAELDRIHTERGDRPDLLETTLREVWLGR